MNRLAEIFQLLGLSMAQSLGPQRLARRREAHEVTDQPQSVLEYDRVLTSKMAILYALGLELIYRVRAQGGTLAVDLACGPGHFTLRLAKHLGYSQVLGIDLSEPMIETATRNAADLKLSTQVQFRRGGVAQLTEIVRWPVDLACLTQAAQHLPDLKTVSSVLQQMDQIVRPEGLILVMDPVRPRTAALADRYIHLTGRDYVERGLPQFFKDFRDSIYASWTVQELKSAIPRKSSRLWLHVTPLGFPVTQIILGLPAGQKRPFLRKGFAVSEHPLFRELYPLWESQVGSAWICHTLWEYKMLQFAVSAGFKWRRAPSHG